MRRLPALSFQSRQADLPPKFPASRSVAAFEDPGGFRDGLCRPLFCANSSTWSRLAFCLIVRATRPGPPMPVCVKNLNTAAVAADAHQQRHRASVAAQELGGSRSAASGRRRNHLKGATARPSSVCALEQANSSPAICTSTHPTTADRHRQVRAKPRNRAMPVRPPHQADASVTASGISPAGSPYGLNSADQRRRQRGDLGFEGKIASTTMASSITSPTAATIARAQSGLTRSRRPASAMAAPSITVKRHRDQHAAQLVWSVRVDHQQQRSAALPNRVPHHSRRWRRA